MLTEPLIQQLEQLRLRGMAAALEQQLASADRAARSFEDRLGLSACARYASSPTESSRS